MTSPIGSATLALSLFLLGSCAATAPDPSAQTLVESLAGKNENIVRLTVHAIPAGGADYTAVASTLASKLGKPSDPEDLQAIRGGEVVVLDEPGAIDVTVPIRMRDGAHTAAAGVTMNASMGRDAAIVAARSIATEIEKGLIENTKKK